MSKVSVLTTVYNEKVSQISRAIISVKNQLQPDLEIEYVIIVDNPDYKNLDELTTFIKNIQTTNFYINLVVNKNNLKLAKSLNKGINLCTSDSIARLDADDWMNNGRLSKQYKLLKDSNSDIVYTDSLELDNETKKREYVASVDSKKIYRLLPLRNVICHSSVMFLKNSVQKVGMYRDLVPAEDYDLWLRMSNANQKFSYIDEPLTSREIRKNSVSNANIYYQMQMAIFVRQLNKNGHTLSIDEEKLDKVRKSEHISKNSWAFKFWQENGLKKIIMGISSPFILKVLFNDLKYRASLFLLQIKCIL